MTAPTAIDTIPKLNFFIPYFRILLSLIILPPNNFIKNIYIESN